ncbi:hypothetical protein W97_08326 [Coniosporium apollinis CBS 100218]|uniref:Alpha galactosidase C-terminal domain-containing protein n=1 Tax=Coniosporium apollinis (strain CBS 100218) TaxID=1168221 RepID=R7Z4P3_CONA1|nr:uncharacterized protein W97_08326 [Coniosporium apollinis CBS 100218]EON69140.1 hypothetical protein W97_08326 [Coniosporium apollinis CBS 100218]
MMILEVVDRLLGERRFEECQNPLGSSAVRRWRYYLPSADVSGNATAAQGDGPTAEIQIWSGSLSGGDLFVGLLNLGPEARTISATLADIFVDEGGPRSEEAYVYWNATAQNYGDSVAAGEPVLLGQYAEVVEAGGSSESLVESHSVLAVRLRRREAGLKRKRDEL